MKTAIDIPECLLDDAIHLSGSRSKREAVVTALSEFKRLHPMRRLVDAFGTCDSLMSTQELERQRSGNGTRGAQEKNVLRQMEHVR